MTEAKVSKTCKHCDHGEAHAFGFLWRCSHPNVVARLDPVKGRAVSCARGRQAYSPCGPMGYCYSGPAEIGPRDMGSSTIEATMFKSNATFSAILPYRLPAPMYATNGWMQTHYPQSTIVQSNGGGGGFLAGALVGGALVGLMDNHDHQNESPPSWEGGGGEMNGGGASDSWDDSSSDCGGGDSGGDSGSGGGDS